MYQRPLIFTLLAWLHLAVALNFPLQIMWLYQHGLGEWQLILAKMSWLNFVVMIVCLVNVILSLHASRWLKLTLPLSMVAVGVNNYFVSAYGSDYTVLETSMATVIFMMTHSSLLFLKSSDILQHPTLRWWLVPSRARLEIPVWVKNEEGDYIPLKTFNLSKTGAFLTGQTPFPQFIHEGEVFTMAIKADDLTYTVEARLIRRSTPLGTYPEGVGIHFEKMGLGARVFLAKVRLKKTLDRFLPLEALSR